MFEVTGSGVWLAIWAVSVMLPSAAGRMLTLKLMVPWFGAEAELLRRPRLQTTVPDFPDAGAELGVRRNFRSRRPSPRSAGKVSVM